KVKRRFAPPPTLSPRCVFRGSVFHVGSDRPILELILKERLEALAQEAGIAAAEAKAVPLYRGEEGVDRTEFGRGRFWTGLTEPRPGMDQIAVVGPFDHHGKALLTVWRYGCRPRFERLLLRDGFLSWSEIEAHFSMLILVEPFVLGGSWEAETEQPVD